MKNNILSLFLLLSVICCKQENKNSSNTEWDSNEITSDYEYKGTGNITQGLAQTKVQSLMTCDQKGGRIAAVGKITDKSGTIWTVPGTNHFNQTTKAFDLYNECNNVTPNNLTEVNLNSVPVSEIDVDGEIITGYIFADNYFELYINGDLIAVDPIPFTPFNSNIVKFKVKTPYTIAIKLIDWEENLGVGSENNRGKNFHPGDGGFIASFSDGTITNDAWKAQTFYTAPISDLSCLIEKGEKRLSTNCSTDGVDDGTAFYGVHWKIPADSFDASFDDSQWPNATTYTEKVIGVENKKAYMNFIEKFSGTGAEFIWSTNVVLDNEVIIRYKVE